MTNIIYRHYQKGDDAQLAYLYMKAFQENLTTYIRTAQIEKWRYPQSPDFEPQMIQIAEDVDKKRIVGAVIVNLVEKININNKKYLVGDINDVSCDPDYSKQGIATRLMENAIEYMKQRKCDLSLLTAAYDGIARKKIYLRFGYQDAAHLNAYVNFPNYFRLIRDFPLGLFITPLIFYLAYLSRLNLRFKLHRIPYFQDFSYEILFDSNHFQVAKLFNRIFPKYYNGFSKYSREKVAWARKNVPYDRERPIYIIMRNQQSIIGGASLSFERLYISPLKTTIRWGIIHEIAIEKDIFPNEHLMTVGIAYLIDKILKAAIQRKIGVLFYEGDKNDKGVEKAFQMLNFRIMKGSVLMMKQFHEIQFSDKKNPWFIPTYVSTGFP